RPPPSPLLPYTTLFRSLDGCVAQALEQAGLTLADLDGIAVTAGPGLIGGVLSGLMTAKALAAATGLPMVGVNHLAGHALTPRLRSEEHTSELQSREKLV